MKASAKNNVLQLTKYIILSALTHLTISVMHVALKIMSSLRTRKGFIARRLILPLMSLVVNHLFLKKHLNVTASKIKSKS